MWQSILSTSNSESVCKDLQIRDCTFSWNHATGLAAAAAVEASQSNMGVADGSGGAVACFDCPCMDLLAVAASHNKAKGFGGAVACSDCKLVNIGQGLFDHNVAAAGGAVSLLQPGAGSSLSGSSFKSNSAGAASALTIPQELEESWAVASNSSTSRRGSGARSNEQFVKGKVVPVLGALPSCTAAGAGGGVCVQQQQGSGFIMGTGNSFETNTAAFGGKV
jgi:predicted outer membrane repeat protein